MTTQEKQAVDVAIQALNSVCKASITAGFRPDSNAPLASECRAALTQLRALGEIGAMNVRLEGGQRGKPLRYEDPDSVEEL